MTYTDNDDEYLAFSDEDAMTDVDREAMLDDYAARYSTAALPKNAAGCTCHAGYTCVEADRLRDREYTALDSHGDEMMWPGKRLRGAAKRAVEAKRLAFRKACEATQAHRFRAGITEQDELAFERDEIAAEDAALADYYATKETVPF